MNHFSHTITMQLVSENEIRQVSTISNLIKTEADAIFGSRFINPREPLKNGMPINRYFGNRAVTFIQNLIVGTKMTEFHSGYRSFKINVLK